MHTMFINPAIRIQILLCPFYMMGHLSVSSTRWKCQQWRLGVASWLERQGRRHYCGQPWAMWEKVQASGGGRLQQWRALSIFSTRMPLTLKPMKKAGPTLGWHWWSQCSRFACNDRLNFGGVCHPAMYTNFVAFGAQGCDLQGHSLWNCRTFSQMWQQRDSYNLRKVPGSNKNQPTLSLLSCVDWRSQWSFALHCP
jgi:hypothetical protein